MTERIDWKYVIGFYGFAIIFAFPFNSFLISDIHHRMTEGSNTNWTKTFIIDLTIIFVSMFIIDKTWKKKTDGSEKHYS